MGRETRSAADCVIAAVLLLLSNFRSVVLFQDSKYARQVQSAR